MKTILISSDSGGGGKAQQLALPRNWRHRCSGYMFQGCYKAILIDKKGSIQELARYVVLNSVCAGLVGKANEWPWSSVSVMVSEVPATQWIAADAMLRYLGKCRAQARQHYRQLVHEVVTEPSILANLK